jgi:hypothetical protein
MDYAHGLLRTMVEDVVEGSPEIQASPFVKKALELATDWRFRTQLEATRSAREVHVCQWLGGERLATQMNALMPGR